MKKLILSGLCCTIAFCIQGQISNPNHLQTVVHDMVLTPSGGLHSNASIPLTSGIDEWLTVDSDASSNLVKVGIHGYDSIIVEKQGTPGWTSYFRFNANVTGTTILDVETDNAGNVYMVGTVEDTFFFNPSTPIWFSNEGLLLVKLDPSGSYEWHKYISGATGLDIELDGSNMPVVLGRKSNGALLMYSYNSSGTKINELSTSSSVNGFCEGQKAVFDGTHFYATGIFYDIVTLGNADTLISSSEGMFIAKITEDLSLVEWTDFAYYPGGGSYGFDIETDECNYPVGLGTWRAGANAEIWLYRYHPDGTFLGSFTYNGTSKHVGAYSLEIDKSTNTFHVGGEFRDSLILQDTVFYADTIRRIEGYTLEINTCMLSATLVAGKTTTSYSSDTILLTGYPSGGIFSGNGVSGNQFDPQVAGPGDHVVTYTFSDCNCTAQDSVTIHVDCYPDDNFTEYINIHERPTQNYPHFKRKESDYFTDSIPDPETGLPVAVQRVISVATSLNNNGDIYLSLNTDSGRVIWTREYGGSALDRGTAVKKCSTGYIVAGTTLSYGGNNQKPFLMRLDASGNISWFNTYDISNHVLSVNVVELNNGDFAMTGFYNAHQYPGQSHDFFTLVTNSSGNMISFRQLGQSNRNWEYMRDVEPTADGGFVIVGNGGHNGDYHAGVIIKFDNTYNIQWANEYRRILGGGTYNLSVAGQRSNIFLTGIKELSNGEFMVVGRSSDHDGSGQNATFRHGLIMKVSANGNWINNVMIAQNSSDFLILHNLAINSNNEVVVVGKTKDPFSGKEFTALLGVDANLGAPTFAAQYDFEEKNEGLCVWESPDGGYTVTGLTGASGALKNPFVLNTDNLGGSASNLLCDIPLALSLYTDPILELPYAWQQSVPIHIENSHNIDSIFPCILIRDCSTDGIPDGRQKVALAGGTEYDGWIDVSPEQVLNKQEDIMELYPNPASGSVYFSHPVHKVTITDVTGRVVLIRESGTIKELSLTELTPGTYIVRSQESRNSRIKATKLTIK